MTDVVIIAQNEGESAEKIIKSIDPSWHIVYVADRCTDNTLDTLRELKEARGKITIIDTTDMNLQGRQTARCRNIGLKHTDNRNDVLFLDGDRYAVGGSYADAVMDGKSDTICFPLEIDTRTKQIFSENYGNIMCGFFSCGLWMKREAINRVVKWQGELFNTELQAEWGIEDTSLGDLCYHLGITSELTDKCVLRGKFDRQTITKTARLKRFMFREPLNVKWLLKN